MMLLKFNSNKKKDVKQILVIKENNQSEENI